MTPAIKLDKKGKLRLSEADYKRIKAMHGRLMRRGGCDMEIDEFAEWLMSKALDNAGDVWKWAWACDYHWATKVPKAGIYRGYMPLQDVQIEHNVPVSRFGRGTRDNLRVSCATCNQRKGGLTGDEFRKLCNVVNSMTDEAQAYIWQKLGQKPKWK